MGLLQSSSSDGSSWPLIWSMLLSSWDDKSDSVSRLSSSLKSSFSPLSATFYSSLYSSGKSVDIYAGLSVKLFTTIVIALAFSASLRAASFYFYFYFFVLKVRLIDLNKLKLSFWLDFFAWILFCFLMLAPRICSLGYSYDIFICIFYIIYIIIWIK